MALPFKAVAVDMDGTLLDDRKQFNHQEFEQILNRLHQQQVHFIVASGRPYARLKQDFSQYASRMDFVTLNGARLIINGQEAATYPLQREEVLDLIAQVHQRYGIMSTMVFEKELAYLNTEAPEEERAFLAYFAGRSTTLDDWQKLPQGQILQLTFNLDSRYAQEIENSFNQKHAQKISAFASASSAIDINARGINKGTGLKRLLAKLGLTGDDLLAFGDGGNDIAMLDFAKYSYAMANGRKEVKKHARYLAPSNNEDGVFRVLNKYLKA